MAKCPTDHPNRTLIIRGLGWGKTNALLNLIKEQDDTDKIYLYAKDLSEPKYQFLIEKLENTGIKHLKDPKPFTECSNSMDDVYEYTDDYNPTRKRIFLIVFEDMIADIMSNTKFQAVVKELFIRCRKVNISLAFISQSCFSVLKDVRLNSTLYLIMNIKKKRELQNIAINHFTDIDYKDFVKI